VLGALTQPGGEASIKQVTDALARLGKLAEGLSENANVGEALADLRQAMADLRTITGRIEAGEGTLGGLIQDPTVYENLAAFLEGAQRSLLLRALIRSAIGKGSAPPVGSPKP
jgi:phospholipid/cholesterol/gamma-HCH transport system substrate-binding protein